MDTLTNAMLGMLFLILGAAGTFLMYRLWGYPFDHLTHKSAAPPGLMRVHRFIGYAYGVLYVVLMAQMLPRLWTYEIEYPARTVAHLVLGMTIGILLLIKVAIVRFFRHLESTLIPFIGTTLLVCTALLIGLSVPFALKEVYLHRSVVGGAAFSNENLERVSHLLPRAGFPQDADINELATVEALKEGRDVLLRKCVTCHDLRTVLARPRTPVQWVETVQRMAGRSVFEPIGETEQLRVAAYLIAISPDLQQSVRQKREQEKQSVDSRETTAQFAVTVPAFGLSGKSFDLAAAREVFSNLCSQCHGAANTDRKPPSSAAEVQSLILRMVDNGLEATGEELEMVAFYLHETYVH
jgi:mono/diheme cytochrome c family protein